MRDYWHEVLHREIVKATKEARSRQPAVFPTPQDLVEERRRKVAATVFPGKEPQPYFPESPEDTVLEVGALGASVDTDYDGDEDWYITPDRRVVDFAKWKAGTHNE